MPPLKEEKEEYTDEEEETDAPDKQSDSPKATPELDIVETEKRNLPMQAARVPEPYDPKLDWKITPFPTLELLDKRNDEDAPIDMEEQNKNKDQIIEVLQNFERRHIFHKSYGGTDHHVVRNHPGKKE